MSNEGYIQYQFPYFRREFINKIKIYRDPETALDAPTHFTLLASNDGGITFVPLLVEDNNMIWNKNSETFVEYNLMNNESYNLYRLVVTGMFSTIWMMMNRYRFSFLCD